MAEHTEAVAVPERAILEQVVLAVDVVERRRDLAALDTRFDQFKAGFVHLNVDVPEP